MEQGKGAINTMDDILNVFNEFIAEFESYNDMVKVKSVPPPTPPKPVKKTPSPTLPKPSKQKQEPQVEVNEDRESVSNLLKKFKDSPLILCGHS
ncbi:ORF18 [Ostreid herpesvirus 1]|uniref:Uncharacterized protein ORF18 n=1 Tax=Ostreid herpesvirus 1 (isolate France) TaxID=654903 RepID=Y018_OSHVF|nr:ORF18 [Ostreid herpesvirus 1]Q6R7K5.1 RecName: Full=Uncharacterized protein ORF18 [Ostreid herpesvirus 1 (isolate France)]AAS00910.1 ORF18 [Ostreid herpesvirus 1]